MAKVELRQRKRVVYYVEGVDRMLNLINFGIGVATLYIAFQVILGIIAIAFTIFIFMQIFKSFKK